MSQSVTSQRILISGATSAMAQAWARLRAVEGASFFLIGRTASKLATLQQDLQARGAKQVTVAVIDSALPADHDALVQQAWQTLSGVDTALFAQGMMHSPDDSEKNSVLIRELFEVNTLGVMYEINTLAMLMKAQGSGTIVAISSVAGDRGRQSNYVYGASKSALSIFLAGLRNRLFPHGVHVIDVKPGFVDTPMTVDYPKGPLWASPEQVALRIDSGIRGNRAVVYAPGFWRLIMLIICSVPDLIFKRLKL